MRNVRVDGLSVNSPRTLNKTDEEDSNHTNPMCYCDKALLRGSRVDQPDQLTPMRLHDGIETVATILVGGSDTHPSQQMTTTVNHWESISSTVWKPKKWLLQSDGSYKPVTKEESGHNLLNSMIPSLSQTPRRVSQTWGKIATLIKQQAQLDESQIETTDNSQDARDNYRTLSALMNDEDITNKSIDDDSTSQCSDTLDTEHDVFKDFIYTGDDPNIDVLNLIQVEGSPALRIGIRKLLEKYRDVFATTLPEESARIPPFELTVDKEKWEQHSNRGPPRVQSPAKQAEIQKQVDELLRTNESNRAF